MSIQNNGTPPTGHEWGERTIQSVGYSAPKHWKSDAYELRQAFGIPEFDPHAFEREEGQIRSMVYPDLVFHEANPSVTSTPKGTDALFIGERGCGKTTNGLSLSQRLMNDHPATEESNANKVVWRGSPKRSGWLPFKKWTTLFLPANADLELKWMNEEDDVLDEDVGLDDVVRDVKRYDDVLDLIDLLAEQKTGTFNVVYPDPSFSGCTELTEETDVIAEPLPFIPKWEARQSEGTVATPLIDWWFAFLLARVERGTHVGWTALIFDETGDLIPQSASNKGDRRLYDKIELLRSIWAESRRARLSMFWYAHRETNVHEKVRREFKWRIQMPDETPNPIQSVRGTYPVGFKRVPMKRDLMSWQDVGTALCYNQTRFTYFGWSDVPDWPEDASRWLRIRLVEPDDVADADVEQTEDGDASLEYEDRIFGEWQNASAHRLYVKEPGSGYVSAKSGEVGEALVSPIEGLRFCEDVVEDGVAEVRMVREADEKEIVVARIPTSTDSPPAASDVGGVGA